MSRILIMGGFADSLVNFRGDLLTELVQRGHKVFACAPGASEELRQNLTEYGVSYYPIKLNRTGVNPVTDLITLFNILKVFLKIKPDIYLGYTIKPVIYGSIIAKLTGVGRIYSIITGLGYTFSTSSPKSRLVGWFASLLHRLMYLNEKQYPPCLYGEYNLA